MAPRNCERVKISGGVENRGTYFSQHFGASFTKRSMVISPADVSNNTDILHLIFSW